METMKVRVIERWARVARERETYRAYRHQVTRAPRTTARPVVRGIVYSAGFTALVLAVGAGGVLAMLLEALAVTMKGGR